MDVEKLSSPTIEVSDITAWDKNGQKLLVSKIRARDIEEDIKAKVAEILLDANSESYSVITSCVGKV